jgi:hypothetical protein
MIVIAKNIWNIYFCEELGPFLVGSWLFLRNNHILGEKEFKLPW